MSRSTIYTAILCLQISGTACREAEQSTAEIEGFQTCNGLSELCDLPLNEVAFAGTHNAMSTAEQEWLFPNQEFGFRRQLDDGIRALNFDTHWWNDEAYLCHSYCDLGNMRLVEGLSEIAEFLAANPDEVLLITIQSALDPEPTLAAFSEAGLREQMLDHHVGEQWPTLAELIEANQRLVVFSSDGGGEDTGYLDQWTHWIDNPYSASSIEDFSCVEDRGQPETASLFNVNHFITHPTANLTDATLANQSDVLTEHLTRCQTETGRFPNQILVDFYASGVVIEVVQQLNQRQ